jgi:hypothetical protein
MGAPIDYRSRPPGGQPPHRETDRALVDERGQQRHQQAGGQESDAQPHHIIEHATVLDAGNKSR